MRRNLLLPALLMGIVSSAFSQVVLQPVSARYLALGAYSSSNVDIYATRNNSASLAQLPQAAAAVYAERRFNLEGLNLYTASVGLPTKSGTFALHGSYFGSELSNQSQFSLAYGRKITDKLDIGAAFYYNGISQSGIYGSASAITGAVSILLHVTDKIHAGINAYNPISVAYGKAKDEKLAAQYTMGLGFDASDKLYISTELVKEEGQNLNVNAGFQYQFVKQFFIRGGIATQTTNYFLGLGFRIRELRLDVSSSYHPQLGLSPGLLLMYSFGKVKNEAVSIQ